MLLLILLFFGMSHGQLLGRPRCVKYDVESTGVNKHIKVLDRGDLSVVKVKDPRNDILGEVKIGNLKAEGNCLYKSRYVLIDNSKPQKVVQVTTEYTNKRRLISEYIEVGPGVYKDLVRKAVPLNMNDESLPNHVHSAYDHSDDLFTIKVKDSLQHTKIGNVTLNDRVIEDVPTSLERFIHIWESDTGKRHIKIDTHLADSRVISHNFVEETPGSKKYVEIAGCKDFYANPFGCNTPNEI